MAPYTNSNSNCAWDTEKHKKMKESRTMLQAKYSDDLKPIANTKVLKITAPGTASNVASKPVTTAKVLKTTAPATTSDAVLKGNSNATEKLLIPEVTIPVFALKNSFNFTLLDDVLSAPDVSLEVTSKDDSNNTPEVVRKNEIVVKLPLIPETQVLVPSEVISKGDFRAPTKTGSSTIRKARKSKKIAKIELLQDKSDIPDCPPPPYKSPVRPVFTTSPTVSTPLGSKTPKTPQKVVVSTEKVMISTNGSATDRAPLDAKTPKTPEKVVVSTNGSASASSSPEELSRSRSSTMTVALRTRSPSQTSPAIPDLTTDVLPEIVPDWDKAGQWAQWFKGNFDFRNKHPEQLELVDYVIKNGGFPKGKCAMDLINPNYDAQDRGKTFPFYALFPNEIKDMICDRALQMGTRVRVQYSWDEAHGHLVNTRFSVPDQNFGLLHASHQTRERAKLVYYHMFGTKQGGHRHVAFRPKIDEVFFHTKNASEFVNFTNHTVMATSDMKRVRKMALPMRDFMKGDEKAICFALGYFCHLEKLTLIIGDGLLPPGKRYNKQWNLNKIRKMLYSYWRIYWPQMQLPKVEMEVISCVEARFLAIDDIQW